MESEDCKIWSLAVVVTVEKKSRHARIGYIFRHKTWQEPVIRNLHYDDVYYDNHRVFNGTALKRGDEIWIDRETDTVYCLNQITLFKRLRNCLFLFFTRYI